MVRTDVGSQTAIRDYVGQSRLLAELSRLQTSLGEWAFGAPAEVRPLHDEEIHQLVAHGNVAEDWKCVLVHPDFRPECVWHSRFLGPVILGPCRGTVRVHDVPLPTGIYRATLREVVVGADALVQDVSLADHVLVGPRAAVVGVRRLVGQSSSYGNGHLLHLGVTTGERKVPVFAECLYQDLVDVIRGRLDREAWTLVAQRYTDGCRWAYSVVGAGARVLDCGLVRAVWIDSGAVLSGCSEVAEVTVLADTDRPARVGVSSIVRRSLLQWGAEVLDGAIVEDSLICEGAKVGRYAKVRHSVIGPDTACYQAEVTSSVVGPLTGINHDALLIAALWEHGKGNLSAGARVGSNHTGKAPDQECHAGEGTFFGLGVSVKYPCNLRRAPYTLIASGATLLPQELAYPFSLVLPPRERPRGIATGYNELFPAWVLYAAPYSVVRNETKYASRCRARHSAVDTSVFRPDIVRLMADARRRLLDLTSRDGDVFTDADDPGIGKNFVTRAACQTAVEAYTEWIRLWVLRALWTQLRDANGGLPGRLTDMEVFRWAAQEGILTLETDEEGELVEGLLEELLRLEHAVAVAVEQSKSRDYRRASRILPGYADLVPLPNEDAVVRACWDRVRELELEVKDFLGK